MQVSHGLSSLSARRLKMALAALDDARQDEHTLSRILALAGEGNVDSLRGRLERDFAAAQQGENASKHKVGVGMAVSLDHSIFFHHPRLFRADDWMFSEMESPWAGDGRGFVYQRIWAPDGTLIATCTQEVSSASSIARGLFFFFFFLTQFAGSCTFGAG